MNTKSSIKTILNDMFTIVNGPPKDVLFDSCKYAYGDSSIAIDFDITNADATKQNHIFKFDYFKISGIQHEDDSGNKFMLSGYCRIIESKTFIVNNPLSCKFEAYYHANSREGWIVFSK